MKRPGRLHHRMLLLSGWLVTVCAAAPAIAQDARVLTDATDTEAWIGERVVIAIELFSPAYFTDTPSFYLPRVSGAVLMKRSEAPVLRSETIDGYEYTVQRHEVLAFAQRPGLIEIPPIGVRFSVSGDPPTEIHDATPGLQFVAKIPPGTEAIATFVTTPNLSVSDTWGNQPHKARVGDAFTRTITIDASNVPGMLLPVVQPLAPEGIRSYLRDPLVEDSNVRGVMTGRRTETISYLCESAGRFTLPEQRIYWWDPVQELLHEEVIPGVSFSVAAAPAELAKRLIGLVVMLAVLLGFAWLKRDRIRTASRAGYAKIRSSERRRFRQLMMACAANDAPTTLRSLDAWRSSLKPGDRARPAAADRDLAAAIRQLESCVYGPAAPAEWSGAELAQQLRVARRNWREQRRRQTTRRSALPELNPSR